MAKKRTIEFRVMFDVPEGATVPEMREYVSDAVVGWCGSLRPAGALYNDDPGDPMFYLDRDSVRVTRLLQRKK